jgi:hypothetical protein
MVGVIGIMFAKDSASVRFPAKLKAVHTLDRAHFAVVRS